MCQEINQIKNKLNPLTAKAFFKKTDFRPRHPSLKEIFLKKIFKLFLHQEICCLPSVSSQKKKLMMCVEICHELCNICTFSLK